MPEVTITVPDDLLIASVTVYFHMGKDTDRGLFDRIASRHDADVREPTDGLPWAHAAWTADGVRYELFEPHRGAPSRTLAHVSGDRA